MVPTSSSVVGEVSQRSLFPAAHTHRLVNKSLPRYLSHLLNYCFYTLSQRGSLLSYLFKDGDSGFPQHLALLEPSH